MSPRPLNVSIFSDASFDHELRVGGWGGWARSDRGLKTGGGAFRSELTNNAEAEAYAAVNAIAMSFLSGVAQDGDRLIVGIDNESVMTLLRGERAPALDWQLAVIERVHVFADRLTSIEFRHVKAHSPRRGGRNFVNEICDRLAKAGLSDARIAAEPERHLYRAIR